MTTPLDGAAVLTVRQGLNTIISNEWGWAEDADGNASPREPEHNCMYARGAPSCATCDDYAAVLDAWLLLERWGAGVTA